MGKVKTKVKSKELVGHSHKAKKSPKVTMKMPKIKSYNANGVPVKVGDKVRALVDYPQCASVKLGEILTVDYLLENQFSTSGAWTFDFISLTDGTLELIKNKHTGSSFDDFLKDEKIEVNGNNLGQKDGYKFDLQVGDEVLPESSDPSSSNGWILEVIEIEDSGFIAKLPGALPDSTLPIYRYSWDDLSNGKVKIVHKANKPENNPKQGIRYNQDKLRWRNFPMFLVEPLVEVGAHAELREGNPNGKYPTLNFLKGLKVQDTLDSMKRHLVKFDNPYLSDFDDETKCNELAHIAWNALVALYTIKYKPELDDREKLEE